MLPIAVTIVVGIFCGALGLVLGGILAAGGHADDCAECLARRLHRQRRRSWRRPYIPRRARPRQVNAHET